MSNFEIVFLHPWLLFLILPVTGMFLFPFFKVPAQRRRTAKKIIPLVLRVITGILVILMLSGVSFVITKDTQSVMLVLDLSDSTQEVHEDIISFANDFLKQSGKNMETGVLAFGGNSVYEVELGEKDEIIKSTEVDASGTDIASALETAASLLSADSNRRIILVSDGKETCNDAGVCASNMAKQGIRIDTVYFETSYLDETELQISDFALPTESYRGDVLTATVTLQSNAATNGTLTIYDNGEEIKSVGVMIAEGSNTYSYEITAGVSGVHSYSVNVTNESDTLEMNNTMYAYVNVAGESSILIIADNIASTAKLQALLDADYDLTIVNSIEAPTTLTELCNYDEVILFNVDADDLPSRFGENLSSYVRDYGRSLLTVGGNQTYMYGNMEGTIYEEMMPVSLSLTEDANGGSVALMLVLDCSMSMSQQSTYLSIAKQSAIKSVEAMSEQDYVGVISFNRSAYLKSELIKATETNKNSLTRIISGLTTSQGTYYVEALELAYAELMKSDAATRHVIFLSDGEPSDRGYESVVSNMYDDGITVSTIALGYSSSVLSALAQTGGGRYYAVTSASNLPDVMVSETEQISVSSLIEETVTPVITKESDLTEGIRGSLPSLSGYLGVTMKEDADKILATESGNPIYAEWQYGLGTVASFMSDLEGKWSSQWLSSQVGQSLTLRMVETIFGETHKDSTIAAEIESNGTTASVCVTVPNAAEGQTMKVIAISPEGASKEYTLKETEKGTYEGAIETEHTGVYSVKIIQYDGDGNVVDYLDTAVAVSYSKEYDAFVDNGQSLMSTLCSYSNGLSTDSVDTLVAVEMSPITLIQNPYLVLGILVALFLLADFIVRMLRWKDIVKFLFHK